MPDRDRATLAEHDGLPFNAVTMAHPVDLGFWHDRAWITHDLATSRFRLTAAGRHQAQMCCGNCADWHPQSSRHVGECRSMDRLDGDRSKGPASATREYSTCEAWRRSDA